MHRDLERPAAAESHAMRPRPFHAQCHLDPRLARAEDALDKTVTSAGGKYKRESLELPRQQRVERAVGRARAKVERSAFELEASLLRRADQDRRRGGSEVEADADAGRRGCRAGLEWILDCDAIGTDQDAERGRDVGARQDAQPDLVGELYVDREKRWQLRFDDEPGQHAAARGQL